MARTRKTAERLLLVLLSASILFNSPSLGELVFCVGPDCVPEEGHAAEDPCESAAEPTEVPSLHFHEKDGGCTSCIRLSLLQNAGESTRPSPRQDGLEIFPLVASISNMDSQPRASRHRILPASPLTENPHLEHLRAVRLLI